MEKETKQIIDSIYSEIELLDTNFKQIEYYIKKYIKEIKNSSSFEKADEKFDILLDILLLLWKIVFNSNYKVNKYIYTIFSDFDRIDNLNERKRLYTNIKKGMYN